MAAVVSLVEKMPDGWERDRVILKEIIHPMMAADFEQGIALLKEAEITENSRRDHALFFQYVPGGRLPELRNALLALGGDDRLRHLCLPDLVHSWAKRDTDAVAAWMEESVDAEDSLYPDIQALVAASRYSEGTISDGLGAMIEKASEPVRGKILHDLFLAAVKLPGDPAHRGEQLLAITPVEEQAKRAAALVGAWSYAEPQAASEWALSFEDTDLSVKLLSQSLSVFFSQESLRAESWSAEKSETERESIDAAREVIKSSRRPPL
jgi:hypothetical protein